jgi:hypothetical protein
MKHFDIGQWVDFTRGLGDELARSAMEMHLSTGCQPCQRVVDVMRGVADAAQLESGYVPPDYAIRMAKAIYPPHGPEKSTLAKLVARLVFDSFGEPVPAGVRSQDRPARHALFEAENFCLDLQLEPEQGSGRVILVGQIANREEQPTNLAHVPVWLRGQRALVASTRSNRFGEFHLAYEPTRNLRLCVDVPAAGKRLEVPLSGLMTGRPSRGQRRARTAGRPAKPKR